MELSIWSSYYIDLSPEDMVCEFEKSGISCSELSDEHADTLLKRGNAKKVGKEFKEFAEKHNVRFPQGHLWLSCRLCDNRKLKIEILKNWLDLFYAIGIKRAVLHCDGVSFSECTNINEMNIANISAIKELTDYIKDTDMIICIENLRSYTQSADSLLEIINGVGGNNIGICLDTGHLNLTDKNQDEFIQKSGNNLKALHIADNEGLTDQHMMPFGRGNVDFIKVVRALKACKFDGTFNLEIPGENSCPLEVRRYKLEYIRKIHSYLMTIE